MKPSPKHTITVLERLLSDMSGGDAAWDRGVEAGAAWVFGLMAMAEAIRTFHCRILFNRWGEPLCVRHNGYSCPSLYRVPRVTEYEQALGRTHREGQGRR